MKLLAIEIVGFGKWQQQKIDFREGNQLIYGANEMGKSTIYQFIQAIFFGFPTKGKRRKDYQPKNGGLYGGRLWLKHPVYGDVQVERFKDQQRGQAKVYFNDQIGDETVLKKILHPLTKELFQQVFTFQQEQLSLLGKLDEENLQRSLLSLGVSGSQKMLNKREEYLRKSQIIYKGKGSQPVLNQKLEEYHLLQQKINDKEQQEQVFQENTEELARTQLDIQQHQEVLRTTKQELNLIEKQVMNLPLYEEYQQLTQIEQSVERTISSNDKQRLNDVYQEYHFLNQEILRLNQEIANQTEKKEQPQNYLFYLEHEQHIQRLLQQRYEIEKLLNEIDWMQQSVQNNLAAMQPLEKQWGWTKEQPPQLFFDEQQAERLREEKVNRTLQVQRLETDIQLLEKEIETREQNLSTFEKLNPQLFQKSREKKSLKFPFLILAVVIVLSSFFVAAPIRYLFWVLAFLSFGIGVLPLFYGSKDQYNHEKQQWQEKLSQLDFSNATLLKLKEEIQELVRQDQLAQDEIVNQSIKNYLGNMDRIEYWVNYRTDITRYLILVNENQELEHQLIDNQQKILNFLELTEPFLTELSLVGNTLKERIQRIGDFASQMEKVRFAKEYQADDYTRQTLKEVQEKQRKLMINHQGLLQKYHISNLEEVPNNLQKAQSSIEKQKRKQELKDMLGELYVSFPKKKAKELPSYYQAVKQQLALAEDENQELLKKEQRLLYQKQQMITDGTLDDLRQEQSDLKTVIEELSLKWFSYQLSALLVIDLLTELSEQQLPNLLKKATEFFQILTNYEYQTVQLFEGQLAVIKRNHVQFMIHELSTGTTDQLIMAVRFAFIFMQSSNNLCPIMIDDGWLHYDSTRKRQLAELFQVFGQKNQVICFSSDQEMVSYYQELDQPIIDLEGV